MVGQYLAAGGTLSPTQLLARCGYAHAVSVLGPTLVGALIQVAAVSTVRKGSLLAMFGISAVIARLWSYHYSHDDTMMIFLLLAPLCAIPSFGIWILGGPLVVGLSVQRRQDAVQTERRPSVDHRPPKPLLEDSAPAHAWSLAAGGAFRLQCRTRGSLV